MRASVSHNADGRRMLISAYIGDIPPFLVDFESCRSVETIWSHSLNEDTNANNNLWLFLVQPKLSNAHQHVRTNAKQSDLYIPVHRFSSKQASKIDLAKKVTTCRLTVVNANWPGMK